MRGSRIIGIIALVAALAAIGLATALKHQENQRRARVHQIAR
jgi:cell division septation protein DedD